MKLIIISYLIYIIIYETLVLGGFGYVVFVLHRNHWWMLLAVIMSAGAYSPYKWNDLINPKEPKEDD